MNTSRSYNSLDYKVSKGVLSKEEEIRLIKAAQEGDKEALDTLVNQFIGVIFNRIHDLFPSLNDHEFEDLAQDCLVYLIKAINEFDANGSARFGTYFYLVISRQIPIMYWTNFHPYTSLNKWRKSYLIRKYMNYGGHTLEEASEHFKIALDEAMELIDLAENVPQDISEQIGEIEELSLREDTPENIFINNENVNSLIEAIDTLPDREKYIILHLFGVGGMQIKSAKEIASDLRISVPHVWYLRRKAFSIISQNLTTR